MNRYFFDIVGQEGPILDYSGRLMPSPDQRSVRRSGIGGTGYRGQRGRQGYRHDSDHFGRSWTPAIFHPHQSFAARVSAFGSEVSEPAPWPPFRQAA